MSNSQECLASALEKLEYDPAIDNLICSTFQDLEVSDMANYWIDFMSMVTDDKHVCYTCNWEEYLISLREMMPGLSSTTRPTTHVRYHIGSTQQDGYRPFQSMNLKLHLNLILILNLNHWGH